MPNLTITFTPPSPAPSLGYRVKYWNANTPGTVITVSPNPSSSPVVISGLAAGCYAGTIEAVCSAGVFSSAVNFSACTPSPTYYYYSVNKYDCATCTLDDLTFVARSSTQLSTTSGTHYKVGSFTYVINNQITPAPSTFDVDLDNAPTGSTCSGVCGGGAPLAYQYEIADSGFSLCGDACSNFIGIPTSVVYSVATQITNLLGSFIYVDSNGVTPFTGNNQFYRIQSLAGSGQAYTVQVTNTGEVISISQCNNGNCIPI